MNSTLDISGIWLVRDSWWENWSFWHNKLPAYEVVVVQKDNNVEMDIPAHIIIPRIIKGTLAKNEFVMQGRYCYGETDEGERGANFVTRMKVRFAKNGRAGTSFEKCVWQSDTSGEVSCGSAVGHWKWCRLADANSLRNFSILP